MKKNKPGIVPKGEDTGDLAERLRRARARLEPSQVKPGKLGLGLPPGVAAMAFRIGAEMVSALLVGVGAGMLLDKAFGSRPVFLIILFFLGAAAGVMNVYRAVNHLGMAPGFFPGTVGTRSAESESKVESGADKAGPPS